jgi:hypothetical protein
MSERVRSTAVLNFVAQRVSNVDAALDEVTEPGSVIRVLGDAYRRERNELFSDLDAESILDMPLVVERDGTHR